MKAVPVVDILKLGMTGLVFLFALLGYRLVAEQQRSQKKSPALTRFFIWMTLASAVFTGLFGLTELWMRENRRDNRFAEMSGVLTECHRNLVRLDTSSKLPGITIVDLQAMVRGHIAVCGPLIERLDD